MYFFSLLRQLFLPLFLAHRYDKGGEKGGEKGTGLQFCPLLCLTRSNMTNLGTTEKVPWDNNCSSLCAPLNMHMVATTFILSGAHKPTLRKISIVCIDDNISLSKINMSTYQLFVMCGPTNCTHIGVYDDTPPTPPTYLVLQLEKGLYPIKLCLRLVVPENLLLQKVSAVVATPLLLPGMYTTALSLHPKHTCRHAEYPPSSSEYQRCSLMSVSSD